MVKVFTSFFLIFIVLLGTIGVNYDSHYCGGVLVDQQLSILPSDLSCGMSADFGNEINSSNESSTYLSEVCCENQHLGFNISDDYNDYQATNFQFISNSSFPELEVNYISFTQDRDYCFLGYSPPPRFENILLVKESFLI
ncbi:MAG: hypothetical protein HRT58_08195 [Crocinitomicaceae bacterium]|nr:hypothetical protein [Flavobacteriales bacterium]NQZ35629.1 hypothetical protein [Crocinitomicaceae bacterium]